MDSLLFCMILTLVTLTGSKGQGDTCSDVLPDCHEYTKSACQAPYESWGRKNCARFCGFCTPACADQLSDCKDYGQSSCVAPYESWARQNCAKTCGYCGANVSPSATSPTTQAVAKTDCLYRGKSYQLGEEWNDGCQYNCTCEAGRAYRCKTTCPTFINPPLNCHYQAIDGQCCRKLVCSGNPNTPVIGDTGCLYNKRKYVQGDTWTDGCSVNCTCVDGRSGQYKCVNTCPDVKPADGCVIVKRNGSCCPESVCNLHKASETNVAGCRYNGLVYEEGDEWHDGCSLTINCKDAATGYYTSQPRCLDLLLPKICHLDPAPAGKCCQVPNCPASYPYNYPPGYILE
ncbi:kielin/chordin-like protein [Saccostrea cucullata]|uniref:kielin/chordin-like protein n=1 Tax=Saccostrea cuccullata TaxID=36930 RepID=UPI002ED3AC26